MAKKRWEKWENWANTVRYEHLEKRLRPATLAEVRAYVALARPKKSNWKLRAVGGGHAWSNLGVPKWANGVILQTDRLLDFKIKKPTTNANGDKVVEVPGGIRIKDLNKKLSKMGLALENMGDAHEQTIAGAIATETHGSAATLGSLSEQVEGMVVVAARGKGSEVVTLTDEQLRAGRVSLGQLGVVYRIALRVVDQYWLREKRELVKIGEEDIVAESDKHRFLEYWYYPHTEWAEKITRVQKPTGRREGIANLAFHLIGAGALMSIGENRPEDLPKVLESRVKEGEIPTRERENLWHKIYPGRSQHTFRIVPTQTMEYQLPRSKFSEAFKGLEDSIKVAREKGVFVGWPVHIRFTAKSNRSLLSHLRFEPTVSFSMSHSTAHRGAHTWLPWLERELLKYDGLPHWGKMYYTDPVKDPEFEAIRQDLDPDGVFAFEQGPYTPDPDAFQ